MNMKKILTILAAVMLICAFTGSLALATDKNQQNMSQGQSNQDNTNKHFQMGAKHIRGSELMGADVKNNNGDDLGSVKDIVMDRKGDVRYIILSANNNLVPIPFRDVKVSQDDQNLLVNISKDKLDKAPNFSDNDWNKIGQPEFDQRVNAYFGQH
jgi:sporulation protein YlmC with PRC-barrel domain